MSFRTRNKPALSTLHPEEEIKFVVPNLGVYTPDCEVPSAKVLVSAAEATPSGVTVCFGQYDNTVRAELLTGEFFVLEKKDGDQWAELEAVIEDAAFNAFGNDSGCVFNCSANRSFHELSVLRFFCRAAPL